MEQERIKLQKKIKRISTEDLARYTDVFKEVETFCLFIGHGRSGHSLIGALLDAHPEIIISQDMHVVKLIEASCNREQLFYLLLKRSEKLAARERGRSSIHYSYFVPNQWQGRFRHLRVLGDKRATDLPAALQRHSNPVQLIRDVVSIPLKLIQVVRNPYDNIATIFKRKTEQGKGMTLPAVVDLYFWSCKAADTIARQAGYEDVFQLRLEKFITDPISSLKDLCLFLSVEPTDDYLRDCASIVYESPHQSRHNVQWTPELIELVRGRMRQFPYLEGYSYED